MSAKDDHLAKLKEIWHKKENRDLAQIGCLERHVDYGATHWKDCNYRKQAHEYSIANDTLVYNVPSMRSSERWLEFTLGYLDMPPNRGANLKKVPLSPLDAGQEHCWDLVHTISDSDYNPNGNANFTEWSYPYLHNTHHIFACAEVYGAFTEAELETLITAKYNVNRLPNLIILPVQRCIAWAIKLPAHCPDKGNHNDYSARVRAKLQDIKANLLENEDGDQHPLTEENAPDLIEEMADESKNLRQYLIAKGYANPGVNLDLLSLV